MSTSQVFCDKALAKDTNLLVDKVKGISRKDSLRRQGEVKPSAPDAEDNVSYCEPFDLVSTSHVSSYTSKTAGKFLGKKIFKNTY